MKNIENIISHKRKILIFPIIGNKDALISPPKNTTTDKLIINTRFVKSSECFSINGAMYSPIR